MDPQFLSRPLPVKRSSLQPSDRDIIAFCERRLGFTPDEQQRRVLTSDAHRVIINCTRQWGKTTVSAATAVHRAYTIPQNLIVVASPGLRQSGEWVIRAEEMVARLGIPVRGDGTNRVSIQFKNGSRIVGLPDAPEKIRGFTASMLVIDEAAYVDDRSYYESLRAMLSVSDGDIWMMSTPNGKRGFFYETWIRNDPSWLKVSVNADQCPRISKGFLAEQRAELTRDVFNQEHMCEFVGSGDATFDRDLVEASFDYTIRPL